MKYFPENTKTFSVIPLEKDKLNKNEILNFRPVNLLSTFSKVYERVMNN